MPGFIPGVRPAVRGQWVSLPLPADQAQPINPTITLSLGDPPDAATVQFSRAAAQHPHPAAPWSSRPEVSLVDRRSHPAQEVLRCRKNDYYVVLGAEIRRCRGRRCGRSRCCFAPAALSFPAPPPAILRWRSVRC